MKQYKVNFNIVLFPSELPHRTRARRMLHDFIILALLAATAQVVESQLQIAPQVVYQKLENTLIADSSLLYKLREVLISSKIWPQSLVHFHIRVKVGSTQPLDCENSSLPGGRSIFPYNQDFQWSSSALVDMISLDQLFILDNVISYSVFGTIERHDRIFVPLQIDTLPCEPTKDELQAAFMQLLPWVCIIMYIHVCTCICVMMLSLIM